jgi:hypothetical protein
MKYFIIALLYASVVNGHEFTPTYPKFTSSYVDNVVTTRMKLFNKRREILYYEIGVFDVEWNALSFASETKIVNVEYLGTKSIDIYIKNTDLDRVEYICSISKIIKGTVKSSGVKSKICSRVK